MESEEVLGEILGHSDFDGEGWGDGDLVVFEDGTGASIEKQPGDQFHVWSEVRPLDLSEVVAEIRSYGDQRIADQVSSWSQLFEKLSAPVPKASFWRRWFTHK